MAVEIFMPKLGLNMDEGQIIEWLADNGAEIKKGQEIVSIETDKVVNSVEAENDGKLYIVVSEGQSVPVGQVIGYILAAGESAPQHVSVQQVTKDRRNEDKSMPTNTHEKSVKNSIDRKASPAARKLASSLGVDLNSLAGTGPQGRISLKDVQAAAGSEDKENMFRGIRKTVGDHMLKSTENTAPCTITAEVCADKLILAREAYQKMDRRISFNDVLIQISAKLLQEHPYINCIWEEARLYQNSNINIGLAVNTESGLFVPVLKQADSYDLAELHENLIMLVEKTRKGEIDSEDLSGGTFTITNLGMYSVQAFTPIINWPQTAIIGVGSIEKRPWVRDNQLVIASVMFLSLTFDHRAIDGALAAKFLLEMKKEIEQYPIPA